MSLDYNELEVRCRELEDAVAWHERRFRRLQEAQVLMRDPERKIVCDILANGKLSSELVTGDRSPAPNEQYKTRADAERAGPPKIDPEILQASSLEWVLCGGQTVGMALPRWSWRLRMKGEASRRAEYSRCLQDLAACRRRMNR